jgi:hypothetical protein
MSLNVTLYVHCLYCCSVGLCTDLSLVSIFEIIVAKVHQTARFRTFTQTDDWYSSVGGCRSTQFKVRRAWHRIWIHFACGFLLCQIFPIEYVDATDWNYVRVCWHTPYVNETARNMAQLLLVHTSLEFLVSQRVNKFSVFYATPWFISIAYPQVSAGCALSWARINKSKKFRFSDIYINLILFCAPRSF